MDADSSAIEAWYEAEVARSYAWEQPTRERAHGSENGRRAQIYRFGSRGCPPTNKQDKTPTADLDGPTYLPTLTDVGWCRWSTRWSVEPTAASRRRALSVDQSFRSIGRRLDAAKLPIANRYDTHGLPCLPAASERDH